MTEAVSTILQNTNIKNHGLSYFYPIITHFYAQKLCDQNLGDY
jgi:hypothetical protein